MALFTHRLFQPVVGLFIFAALCGFALAVFAIHDTAMALVVAFAAILGATGCVHWAFRAADDFQIVERPDWKEV